MKKILFSVMFVAFLSVGANAQTTTKSDTIPTKTECKQDKKCCSDKKECTKKDDKSTCTKKSECCKNKQEKSDKNAPKN